MQPEPLKFIPIRKSKLELDAERAEEIKRQLDFLAGDEAKEWKEKFPERLEVDVKRLEEELSKLKVGKPPKEKPLGKEVKPKKSKK